MIDIYVSHCVFELHDATSPQNLDKTAQKENDSDSDSELDDDYNVYDYASSEESDTASIDHLSDGEEEVVEARTKKAEPKPKKTAKKCLMRTF